LNTVVQKLIRDKLLQLFPGSTLNFHFSLISGGSINTCYKVDFDNKTVFCKTNSAVKFPQLFQKEAGGLSILKSAAVIKTPGVMEVFEEEGNQFLIMEWVEEGERSHSFWVDFGESLARMHSVSQRFFGLDTDNYMGSVPQENNKEKAWVPFFWKHRLSPMLELCKKKTVIGNRLLNRFESLAKKLPEIFEEDRKSCLVHGDLWSGNFLCDQASSPVLIDPAVYYGHPSVDLGMTTLFGGFPKKFYDAYHYHAPLPSNHTEQWKVCNLYPLLVHVYLFGSG
jgi:fructosamine-3-kinase